MKGKKGDACLNLAMTKRQGSVDVLYFFFFFLFSFFLWLTLECTLCCGLVFQPGFDPGGGPVFLTFWNTMNEERACYDRRTKRSRSSKERVSLGGKQVEYATECESGMKRNVFKTEVERGLESGEGQMGRWGT